MLRPPRDQEVAPSIAMPHEPMLFPSLQFILADGEGYMQRPRAVMAGNGAARHRHARVRRTAFEDQQHVAARHTVGSEPAVAEDRLQLEDAFIEGPRALHVLG